MRPAVRLLSGAIEGFYGQPWSEAERLQLFEWIAAWGLDTYLYAPKDDLHHRALWREPYAAPEADGLRALVRGCVDRRLRFVYGLSPGLDIDYGSDDELHRLLQRFEQMMSVGCNDFALLFDDIPATPDPRWGSLAAAQCRVANAVFEWLRARRADARLLFCPTAYCGRMVAAQLGGADYLPTIGRELHAEIGIFWTGPYIISSEITVPHIRETAAILRRKPVIWDNLHANDYDGRRFFCGPYAGRALELRDEVDGLLTNPNSEFPLNYVPLRTFGQFVRADGAWNPRGAYLEAMREWAPAFVTARTPIAFDDLLLFGDCYYLPKEFGAEAEALVAAARRMVDDGDADAAGTYRALAARLRAACEAMTELRDRRLFHALSRRLWELREELDLLERFVAARASGSAVPASSHRGGMVGQLERFRLERTPVP